MNFHFEDQNSNCNERDSRLSAEVRSFFEKYNTGNNSGDTSFISEIFADTFFFCGPTGQQTVRREDFLKVLPKMQFFYKSIGQKYNRLTTVKAEKVDDNYIQAKATWEMQFERKDSSLAKVTIYATCLLFRANGLRIVSQIDHQDLNQLLRNMKIIED